MKKFLKRKQLRPKKKKKSKRNQKKIFLKISL